MNDTLHRRLVEKWIVDIKCPWSDLQIVELEYPYNYYGNRGFVDVFVINSYGGNHNHIRICEVKPNLENFGEGIRQLRKAEDALKKGGFANYYDLHFTHKIYLELVTILNEKNYKTMKEVHNAILNLPDNFYIQLYYETDTLEQGFDFLDINKIHFIEKPYVDYGNRLDVFWSELKHNCRDSLRDKK